MFSELEKKEIIIDPLTGLTKNKDASLVFMDTEEIFKASLEVVSQEEIQKYFAAMIPLDSTHFLGSSPFSSPSSSFYKADEKHLKTLFPKGSSFSAKQSYLNLKKIIDSQKREVHLVLFGADLGKTSGVDYRDSLENGYCRSVLSLHPNGAFVLKKNSGDDTHRCPMPNFYRQLDLIYEQLPFLFGLIGEERELVIRFTFSEFLDSSNASFATVNEPLKIRRKKRQSLKDFIEKGKKDFLDYYNSMLPKNHYVFSSTITALDQIKWNSDDDVRVFSNFENGSHCVFFATPLNYGPEFGENIVSLFEKPYKEKKFKFGILETKDEGNLISLALEGIKDEIIDSEETNLSYYVLTRKNQIFHIYKENGKASINLICKDANVIRRILDDLGYGYPDPNSFNWILTKKNDNSEKELFKSLENHFNRSTIGQLLGAVPIFEEKFFSNRKYIISETLIDEDFYRYLTDLINLGQENEYALIREYDNASYFTACSVLLKSCKYSDIHRVFLLLQKKQGISHITSSPTWKTFIDFILENKEFFQFCLQYHCSRQKMTLGMLKLLEQAYLIRINYVSKSLDGSWVVNESIDPEQKRKLFTVCCDENGALSLLAPDLDCGFESLNQNQLKTLCQLLNYWDPFAPFVLFDCLQDPSEKADELTSWLEEMDKRFLGVAAFSPSINPSEIEKKLKENQGESFYFNSKDYPLFAFLNLISPLHDDLDEDKGAFTLFALCKLTNLLPTLMMYVQYWHDFTKNEIKRDKTADDKYMGFYWFWKESCKTGVNYFLCAVFLNVTPDELQTTPLDDLKNRLDSCEEKIRTAQELFEGYKKLLRENSRNDTECFLNFIRLFIYPDYFKYALSEQSQNNFDPNRFLIDVKLKTLSAPERKNLVTVKIAVAKNNNCFQPIQTTLNMLILLSRYPSFAISLLVSVVLYCHGLNLNSSIFTGVLVGLGMKYPDQVKKGVSIFFPRNADANKQLKVGEDEEEGQFIGPQNL